MSRAAIPFVHAKPLLTGWSSSARTCTICPPSTVATRPHAGSHTRQNVLTSRLISSASLMPQAYNTGPRVLLPEQDSAEQDSAERDSAERGGPLPPTLVRGWGLAARTS